MLPMNGSRVLFAHTLAGQPCERWEPLEEHAARVADLAAKFASAFGAAEWGKLLGIWHDLGKASKDFQEYLRRTSDPDAAEEENAPGRVDHSTFGAQYAARMLTPQFGQIVAFCLAGHHAGLADAASDDESTQRSTLQARLKKEIPPVEVPNWATAAPRLTYPLARDPKNIGFQVAFFTRMLFSSLIDADRTATEEFCNSEQASARLARKPTLNELHHALTSFLARLQSTASDTHVNRIRARVLADCRTAASLPPGFFSLQVPTGGGKTYASLAFALEHAHQQHACQFRRVIVAIPFTSIIEQTADAYREALGPLAEFGLVEHHSNIEPRKDTRQNKLAAENWDAPLIVTTNVQLYESLFAAATTPCRKLHRIVRSIIILDEAQSIPVELLRPTLLALKELVANYGCSVVLCTATQPALERREKEFEPGIENTRPIIRDAPALFTSLKRVRVERLGRVSDEQLAQRIAAEQAALCIVNTRPHAAALYVALVARVGNDGCYHLSTFMCAQHRRDKLAEIRQRLKQHAPCRLVSTQLIEAGVDVDFPAVYRAPAGFDSIAQAAGRCNREGLLAIDGKPALGRVYLFETETPPPPGLQRSGVQCAQELIGRFADPLAPAAVEEYFRLFYWTQQHNWDRMEVMPALTDDLRRPELQLQFKTAASRYKIIRDEQTQILVPYNDEARQIRDDLMRGDPVDFRVLRAAQRYTVGVRENWLTKLVGGQLVGQHECGLYWLTNSDAYSPERGLDSNKAGFDPEVLVQ